MNAFEIKEIPGKGRAMIAIKAFKENDVIFEEEPFVSCQYSWNQTYGYASCDHCMRPLETATENVRRLACDSSITLPLPELDVTLKWVNQFTTCPNCQVRYCSEDCRVEALKRYHRVGCMGPYRNEDSHPINVLNEIWKRMHYPPETGTIMLIVRLMAMYQQSANKKEFLDTLQSFQSLIVNIDQQICHKMLSQNFEQQVQQLFSAFCTAFPDESFAVFKTLDAFKALMAVMATNGQGIATSPLAEWVRNVSKLPEDKTLEKLIDDVYNKVGEFSGEFLNNEGSGLYQLQSKINHSCVPNAESSFPYSNDIVVLKAIKPIQVGDEICISYLDECQLERCRHSRQKALKENYIFVCECPKCREQVNEPDVTSDEDDDDDDDMNMDEGDDDMYD